MIKIKCFMLLRVPILLQIYIAHKDLRTFIIIFASKRVGAINVGIMHAKFQPSSLSGVGG